MWTLKGKRGETMWPRLVVNKLLRRKSGCNTFNTDGKDTSESETEDEDISPLPSELDTFDVQKRSASRLSSSSSSNDSPPPLRTGKPPKTPNSGKLMRGNSLTLWTEYINTEEFRVFVGTWNVGGTGPPDDLDLENWFNTSEPSDIYVVGFQEVVPLNAGSVFGSEGNASGPAAKWDALIRKTLNKVPQNSESRSLARSSSAPSPMLSAFSSAADRAKSSKVTTKDDIMFEKPAAKNDFMEKYYEAEDESVDSHESGKTRKRYKRIASKQMVGIFISIWVRGDLRRHIRGLNVCCVGCGIMGCLGNKGSISVSMSLHETSFCFVCAHLASGDKEGDEIRRNSDAAEILKRTIFPRSNSTQDLPETILGHDRIIMFGDLNYRLTLSEIDARSLIDKEDWKTLLESDQLRMEQREGHMFEEWHEGPIGFAPTYKYAPNSDQYCGGAEIKPGEKRRAPAWCDRILWYGKGLKQICYVREEFMLSDHRPVTSIFSADVEVLSNRKAKKNFGLHCNKMPDMSNLLSPNKIPNMSNLLSREIQILSKTRTEEIIIFNDLNNLMSDHNVSVDRSFLPILKKVQANHNLWEPGPVLSQGLDV